MRLQSNWELDSCFVYKLSEPDSTVWEACGPFWGLPTPHPLVRYDGIRLRSVFGQPREVMYFDFGGTLYPSPDTLLVHSATLARGIGVLYEEYYDGPFYFLEGAIINGVHYGTVDVDEGAVTPESFELSQNFPNPFNPTTQISYTLPVAANVSLVVYDVLGREVAHLENGPCEAGVHAVSWNANDQPSGVYICRLEVKGLSRTRKLVLIR